MSNLRFIGFTCVVVLSLSLFGCADLGRAVKDIFSGILDPDESKERIVVRINCDGSEGQTGVANSIEEEQQARRDSGDESKTLKFVLKGDCKTVNPILIESDNVVLDNTGAILQSEDPSESAVTVVDADNVFILGGTYVNSRHGINLISSKNVALINVKASDNISSGIKIDNANIPRRIVPAMNLISKAYAEGDLGACNCAEIIGYANNNLETAGFPSLGDTVTFCSENEANNNRLSGVETIDAQINVCGSVLAKNNGKDSSIGENGLNGSGIVMKEDTRMEVKNKQSITTFGNKTYGLAFIDSEVHYYSGTITSADNLTSNIRFASDDESTIQCYLDNPEINFQSNCSDVVNDPDDPKERFQSCGNLNCN